LGCAIFFDGTAGSDFAPSVLRELLKRDQRAVGIRNDQIEPALTAILFGGSGAIRDRVGEIWQLKAGSVR